MNFTSVKFGLCNKFDQGGDNSLLCCVYKDRPAQWNLKTKQFVQNNYTRNI